MSNARNLFSPVQAIGDVLSASGALPLAEQLQRLVRAGWVQLPQPGKGHTLQRWQALSLVAQHSLSLAKLYEGHTDALAILRELGCARGDAHEVWAMWAAEAPDHRVAVETQATGSQVTLSGSKAWCSGAHGASHALLTAWIPGNDQPQLVAAELVDPSVRVDALAWQAVGMADTVSADVHFNRTPAILIGRPGDYLRRPGFWQGGAGIAACWYGGTLAVADALRASAMTTSPSHPGYTYRTASFGKVDRMLAGTAALLQASAAWIDANPSADAMAVALRARQSAEACATAVLEETGRALGATPFCREERFARAAADLPVFIRQSHGDRDDAALAQAVLARQEYPWAL